jgi:hypothetical protein
MTAPVAVRSGAAIKCPPRTLRHYESFALCHSGRNGEPDPLRIDSSRQSPSSMPREIASSSSIEHPGCRVPRNDMEMSRLLRRPHSSGFLAMTIGMQSRNDSVRGNAVLSPSLLVILSKAKDLATLRASAAKNLTRFRVEFAKNLTTLRADSRNRDATSHTILRSNPSIQGSLLQSKLFSSCVTIP